MRKKLGTMNGNRASFTGTFVRMGTKKGWRGDVDFTILLKDIKDESQQIVCNHLWFNYTKGFEDVGNLEEGYILSFSARVKEYEKGYFGRREDVYKPSEIDYKLSHPTKIRKINK